MAHIRKHPKSGRWQVRYIDPDGRERSKTFPKKVDAERFAATVAADVLRGQFIDPQAGRLTVGEYSQRWTATRSDRARSTRDRDQSYLDSLILPTFGRRTVASLRPSEVQRWAAELNRAPTTVAKAARILFGVLEVARRDGAIRANPAADLKLRKVEAQRVGRALTDDELAKVLEAAEQVDERTAAAIHLMGRLRTAHR